MNKKFLKLFSLLLSVAVVLTATAIKPSAATESELKSNISKLESQSEELEAEIKRLEGEVESQELLKDTIAQKIAVVQQQINACNTEIANINAAISANNAEIEEKQAEIDADKLAYKKRLRAIQMSNSGSNLQVLLGAEDFSEFLQLAQYTASVSARDKQLIDKLMSSIAELEAKQEENDRLLAEQVEIKKTVTAKQQELVAENNKIQSVISEINSTQSDLESKNKDIEKQIKAYNNALSALASAGNTSFTYDGSQFTWPTPGFYGISAGYQSNDPVHRGTHNGIDIAGGGIAGSRIVAMADGVVTASSNACSHNYGKYSTCCGNGYGNYVSINHGTMNGQTYVATYGHMSYAIVSAGTQVKKGQTIGYVGTTGWSTGYHLHLGIAVNGVWQNPMNFFRKVS